MKIIKKVMIIFITMCILLNIMQGTTKAATFPSFSEIVSSGKDWVDKGKNEGGDKVFSDDDIGSFTVPIANMLTAIGTIVIVIAFIVLGIKFIFATPEQAAKIKQQLIRSCSSSSNSIWSCYYLEFNVWNNEQYK